MPRVYGSLAERFWGRVLRLSYHPRFNRKGCWIWLGSRQAGGRGHLRNGRKMEKAPRVAYQLAHPAEDISTSCVLHTCDHPWCVNPAHLWLGTPQDNIADMDRKGRRGTTPGEHHYNAKLTLAQVWEIRLLADDLTGVELSRRFGVTPSAIYRIIANENWKVA